jgi:hypothetical protein
MTLLGRSAGAVTPYHAPPGCLAAARSEPLASAPRLPGRSPLHLEVVHANNVLDDAVAGVVPNVHAKGEVRLGLHWGQVLLDWPRPAFAPRFSLESHRLGLIHATRGIRRLQASTVQGAK